MSWIKSDIEKHGEDAIAMSAAQSGKNQWTYKEMLDAVTEDKPLENGTNPIDDVLTFLRQTGKLDK